MKTAPENSSIFFNTIDISILKIRNKDLPSSNEYRWKQVAHCSVVLVMLYYRMADGTLFRLDLSMIDYAAHTWYLDSLIILSLYLHLAKNILSLI